MAQFLSNALPARHNWRIPQGTTWERVLEWQQPDGTPVDLTGWSGRMQVRDHKEAVVAELTTENARMTLGGTEGTVTLLLDAVTTEGLPTGRVMPYDVELVSPSGEVTRLVQGGMSVGREVTRSG